MKRIVFLDIDGVLASEKYLCSGKGFIDPQKVRLLNQLSDIDTEIVVSSSWGFDNGRTEKSLRSCGLELPIIGYTEHLPFAWSCRGNEIEKWLLDKFGGMATKFGSQYFSDDYKYCIIDDDQDFLFGQKDNFILVNRKTGLTQSNINKIIKILTIING